MGVDSLTLSPSISTGVSSYPLENEVVLFSAHGQNLYRLNPTAAFIWLCFNHGLVETEIGQTLAETFGISLATAREDVNAILQEWRQLGLLGDGDMQPDASGQDDDEALPLPAKKYFDLHCKPAVFTSHRLIGTRFDIGLPDAQVAQWVVPVFEHLKTLPKEPADIRFDIVAATDGFTLLRDSFVIAEGLRVDQIAPYVHAEILSASYRATDCFIAMHAAALCIDGQCILLPGVSGSGKSTLAAALAVSGFEYCTDELTLIAGQTYGVRPVPISLGIKEGAWPILAEFIPGIEQIPCHIRRDQKQVRYLPPPRQFLDRYDRDGLPVKCVIFPSYQPNISTLIRSVSPADALCRIANAGYDVSGRLNENFVAELIDWVSSLTCYELHYSSLHEAVDRVKDIVG